MYGCMLSIWHLCQLSALHNKNLHKALYSSHFKFILYALCPNCSSSFVMASPTIANRANKNGHAAIKILILQKVYQTE